MSWGEPPQQFNGYPPGYPGGPPPKRTNNWVVVGRAVCALIVLGGGIWAANDRSASNSDAANGQPAIQFTAPPIGQFLQPTTPDVPATTAPPTPMALPASAGGLTLLTTSSAHKLAGTLATTLSKSSSAYQNALIGGYGPTASGNYRMLLVAQPFANLDPTDQTQFESTNAQYLVTQLAGGMQLADPTTETSTVPGAAISCGTLDASGHDVMICVWVDAESFGIGYFYDTYFSTSMSEAATYTDALRAAAEAD